MILSILMLLSVHSDLHVILSKKLFKNIFKQLFGFICRLLFSSKVINTGPVMGTLSRWNWQCFKAMFQVCLPKYVSGDLIDLVAWRLDYIIWGSKFSW